MASIPTLLKAFQSNLGASRGSCCDDDDEKQTWDDIDRAIEDYALMESKIKTLEEDLGLTKISLGHKITLLASCEIALEDRDAKAS